ncbi:MAG: ATP-binding cassette domain-containing protein [Clostridia bacterium]|nr:ATP-binding cassette domain-containing protein [Clostridia bacterium]
MKLTINGISKSYGNNRALDAFTAEMTPGIYALLGPNGAGKSTLIHILTENLRADAGEILYTDEAGLTRNILAMGTAYREKLGFMPQYPGLYSHFTVAQFMGYMASLKGVPKKHAKEQIEGILQAVDLYDVANRRIGALSGGMKQRLTLAQAVLGDPEILILDEPTAGLDPKQRISIRNYISRIAFDKIVLIATHVVSDVEYIAKDVILLKRGVIVDNAPPAALTEKIREKVWLVPARAEDVPAMQEKFRVIRITREDRAVDAETLSDTTLRVLSEERPAEQARPAVPSLEDYYLYVFGDAVSPV